MTRQTGRLGTGLIVALLLFAGPALAQRKTTPRLESPPHKLQSETVAELPARCGLKDPPMIGTEIHTLDSKLFGRKLCYLAILPPADRVDSKGEPGILVLLHGLGGTPAEWIERGAIDKRLATAHQQGLIPRTITIIPFGDRGYWTNWPDGKHPYGDVLLTEFLPHARATYKVRRGAAYTAIAGISMGGFGALSIGLKHPEEFGFIAALSATDVDMAITANPKKEDYQNAFGTPPDRQRVRAVNPYHIVKAGTGGGQHIVMSYGSKEPAKFSEGAERLSEALKRARPKVQLKIVAGGTHGWKKNWTASLHRWWLRRMGRAFGALRRPR